MESKFFILEKGKTLKKTNILIDLIGSVSIYSCIFPLVIADVFVTQYQWIYFSINGIPKIDRKKYIIIDRHKLSKLNVIQKINCAYCGYANGLVAYLKEVVNQTERYSCAIKHATPGYGQEHQKNFYPYKKFK